MPLEYDRRFESTISDLGKLSSWLKTFLAREYKW